MYINEFYIKPEYRVRGAGKFLAREITSKYRSVCFFEIKKNQGAKRFWKSVFENGDWTDRSSTVYDTSQAPDWLDWYVYFRNCADE